MPKQMWMGNEQRFQWVPAPSTGMQVTNAGFYERIDYQNGRVGVVRSMQTHKEFNMDFPLQEAAGLEGLDVFQKYASGFYGDMDSNPIFFADPMNYDQNLFPMGWSAPGLYRRGWATVVSDTSRIYYNLALNPSVETDATYYAAVPGTSGVAAGARTLTTSISGIYSYRVTWTTGTSAVSGGFNYTGTPVIAGTAYDFSAYVTSSKIQRVLMTIRYRNGSGTSVGTSVGTQTVLAASTATRLSVLASTAPAGAVTADIEVAAVTGTSGSNWAATDWLQVDAVMINFNTAAPAAYFDGDSTGAGWRGTPHAAASIMYVGRTVPTLGTTAANSYNLPPIQATWNVTTAANATPATDVSIPYAIIPIPPGYTLHFGVNGTATGDAQIVVGTTGGGITPITLLTTITSTRMNMSVSSASGSYAKFYIRRTSNVASTITLIAMMAQLWPTTVTPNLTGNFIEGKGHRGLKFVDNATVESYVMVDRERNVPVHYKGLSTQLVEAQDRG